MKNLQNKSQANKDNSTLELADKIVGWRIKNEFLKKEIAKLDKNSNFLIFSIAAFLLQTQLIEFELKQLIPKLDQHLFFSSTSKVLNRKTRTPKDLNDTQLTLGNLKFEINGFEGNFLTNLQSNLQKLVKLRNHFVHELFNLGTINELIKKSKQGLVISNRIIVDIENVERFLKKSTK